MIRWLKKQILRVRLYVSENYQNEAESLVIWYAVCYAMGAAYYQVIPFEISSIWLVIILEIMLVWLYLLRQKPQKFKLMTYVTIMMLGLCVAKANALYQKKYIEDNISETSYLNGQIKVLDKNSNNRIRLLLDNVNDFEKELKGKFRISIGGDYPWLKEGKCVELVAELPKDYAKNPIGNYNFVRRDFYQSISASGYAVTPLFEKDCAKKPSAIEQYRQKIRENINQNTKEQTAAVIKALTIGDKASITREVFSQYKTSGLAHVLAISGMHMGMIALLVFFLIRVLLAPLGTGQYDLRKPAAVVSLILTLGYFLISGQSISCVRAFIMTVLILTAVLFNRRPISLRLWAFALLIVVSIMPEAVITPGFLMSFAAVMGIVAFYESNKEALAQWFREGNLFLRIGKYLLGIIITDLVASLMTLPFSIYYFHQISVYTSLGNLLAGPLIAFYIMPALLLYLISVPLGLGAYSIKLLSWGIDVLNNIAAWVSSLSGAESGNDISAMPDWGIFTITIGLLWLSIWQAKWRYWGALAVIIGMMSLWTVPQIDFVFDEGGKTFACADNNGKLKSTPWHKNKFLTRMWTGENKLSQDNIALICDKESCTCQKRIKFLQGKVELDGKPIDIKQSGYISLKEGKVYRPKTTKRIWDKQ